MELQPTTFRQDSNGIQTISQTKPGAIRQPELFTPYRVIGGEIGCSKSQISIAFKLDIVWNRWQCTVYQFSFSNRDEGSVSNIEKFVVTYGDIFGMFRKKNSIAADSQKQAASYGDIFDILKVQNSRFVQTPISATWNEIIFHVRSSSFGECQTNKFDISDRIRKGRPYQYVQFFSHQVVATAK